MNYPSKSKVNVAVANNNKFDLSKTVVTTHDFGRAKAIECRYMVPGDKFNIKLSSFTRLLPMVSPTFGKIDTVQRAFFVPKVGDTIGRSLVNDESLILNLSPGTM